MDHVSLRTTAVKVYNRISRLFGLNVYALHPDPELRVGRTEDLNCYELAWTVSTIED